MGVRYQWELSESYHQEDLHCDWLPVWSGGLPGDAQSCFFGRWRIPDPPAVKASNYCPDAVGNQRPTPDALPMESLGFGCVFHVRLHVFLS